MFKKQEVSVDSIVSTFNATITRLIELSMSKSVEAAQGLEDIQKLECKVNAAQEEAKKAEAVAKKIQQLISE